MNFTNSVDVVVVAVTFQKSDGPLFLSLQCKMPPKRTFKLAPNRLNQRKLALSLALNVKKKHEVRVRVHAEYTQHWWQGGNRRKVESIEDLNFTFEIRHNSELQDLIDDKLHIGESFELNDYKSQVCDRFEFEILPDQQPRGNLANVRMFDAAPYTMSFLKYFNGIDESSHQVSVSTGGCVVEALSKRWNVKNMPLFLRKFERASYIVHNKPFDPQDGVDAKMIEQLCWMMNASCLGFDQNSSVFVKFSQIIRRKLTPDEEKQGKTTGKGKKSIVFYCAMAHLYLITDDKLILSITQTFKDCKRTDLKSKVEPEKKQMAFHEFTSLEDTLKLPENSVAIVDDNNVDSLLKQYIQQTKDIPYVKMGGLKRVASFTTKNKVTVTINNTFVANTCLVWTDTQRICEQTDIQFTNQSHGTLLMELFHRFFDGCARKTFSKKERQVVLARQNGICNGQCKEPLGQTFHLDHIKALQHGGNNDLETNIQALCQSCHLEKTTAETNAIAITDCQSATNIEVHNHMISKFFRKSHFSQTFMEIDEDEMLFGSDINKCRRNIMLYYGEEFCVYTVMDNVQPFDGDITPGFYFIESDNTFPLTGNGFYSKPLATYVLENNLISKSQIKWQLKPSITKPSTYFQEFVKHLVKLFGENAKQAVNSFIGCLGRRENSFLKSLFCKNDDIDEMALVKQHLTDPCKYQVCSNVNLFTSSIPIEKLDTFFPIHAQILDCEAVELHKAFVHVQKNGGIPVAIKTDCVLYRAEKRIVNNAEWAPFIPKFKNEDKSTVPTGTFSFKNAEKFKHEPTVYKIVESVYGDSDLEATLLDRIIQSEKGLCILGSAGTGKSTLLNRLGAKLAETKTIVRLTPTNKAALIIGGKTLDKFAHQMLSKNNKCTVDYIFVDEISMVRECFYHLLLSIKFANPAVKIVISGDFHQLPPVDDRVSENVYESSHALFELVDGNLLRLTKCMRANTEFFDITESLRLGQPIDIERFKNQHNGGTKLHLCCTNDTRKRINETCMKAMTENDALLTTMKISKLSYAKESQDMTIFRTMPIIARLGNKSFDICNNETFAIEGLDVVNEKIYIINDRLDEHIVMTVKEFRTHFLPAFCITIHKSQGETYNFPYTIHEWSHPRMTYRMKYVAVSRATGSEHVRIN